jgi:hypothetical protein
LKTVAEWMRLPAEKVAAETTRTAREFFCIGSAVQNSV